MLVEVHDKEKGIPKDGPSSPTIPNIFKGMVVGSCFGQITSVVKDYWTICYQLYSVFYFWVLWISNFQIDLRDRQLDAKNKHIGWSVLEGSGLTGYSITVKRGKAVLFSIKSYEWLLLSSGAGPTPTKTHFEKFNSSWSFTMSKKYLGEPFQLVIICISKRRLMWTGALYAKHQMRASNIYSFILWDLIFDFSAVIEVMPNDILDFLINWKFLFQRLIVCPLSHTMFFFFIDTRTMFISS